MPQSLREETTGEDQVMGATTDESPLNFDGPRRGDRPDETSSASSAIREAKPMVWLTAVEGGARVLSFGFYLLAARVLAPSGFGVVQYTITVAMLAFGAIQVLVTAIIRELGVDRGDALGTREVLGSSLAAAVGLWAMTSVLCLAAQAAGLAGGADTLGLLAVIAGTAAFQIYYAIGRGLGDQMRQAASYAGASFAQLIMFGALAIITDPTPTQALLIFGGSSFVPVLIYEWWRPVLPRASASFEPLGSPTSLGDQRASAGGAGVLPALELSRSTVGSGCARYLPDRNLRIGEEHFIGAHRHSRRRYGGAPAPRGAVTHGREYRRGTTTHMLAGPLGGRRFRRGGPVHHRSACAAVGSPVR